MPSFPRSLLNPESPSRETTRQHYTNTPVNMTRSEVYKLTESTNSPTLSVYEGGLSCIQHPIAYYIFKGVNK